MSADTRRLYIAAWSTRFWAWLIDVLVVGAVVNAFWGVVGATALPLPPVAVGRLGEAGGLNGLGLWLYWTLLEGHRGQSIGKLVLNLRVTDREGDPITYGAAAIESFGKAFLLPIDLVVGVLAYEGRKLRLFNRLSETIVVETDAAALDAPEGVEYVLPEDR
ncbi:MAG: RDD family protein [Haloferacaceae archaeon]